MRSIEQARRLVDLVLGEVPWAVAVFDHQQRYAAYNRNWALLHGFTNRDDVLGRRHDEVESELVISWSAAQVSCLAGEVARSDDEIVERKDGGRDHLRWVATPWRSDDGQPNGVVIFVENITERVETRRRLMERDALVRDLFERSPIGLNLCRMDGLWLESNPAFLDIIGYGRAEADGGLTYWQLTPRSYDDAEAEQLAQLRATRRYGPYEKEFIRKDGRHVPVRLNGFVVERNGEPYIWSLIEDLTAQRKLESDLEVERLKAIQTAKLATLGEMAAGIAHEINNPLQIIDSYAFLLGEAVARNELGVATSALAAIREAVARAADIVQGLKRYARKAGDSLEPVDIAKLVQETLTIWRTRLRAEAVSLEVNIAPGVVVLGRPIELGQVLVNLLNNAFDAVRGRDNGRIALDLLRMEKTARIVVEDSGPPISPAVRSELFRAFFTTKPAGQGTGLGLSISREIVERHGGSIELADSEATRFVVELPRVALDPEG
ncbi:MAG: PAS domain S-box protein [Polyangiaceae bacterium]